MGATSGQAPGRGFQAAGGHRSDSTNRVSEEPGVIHLPIMAHYQTRTHGTYPITIHQRTPAGPAPRSLALALT